MGYTLNQGDSGGITQTVCVRKPGVEKGQQLHFKYRKDGANKLWWLLQCLWVEERQCVLWDARLMNSWRLGLNKGNERKVKTN